MTTAADSYFLRIDEPTRSCLLALRSIILRYNDNVAEVWRYGMPFYTYKGKRFCYLWTHKKYKLPYIGIVDGNRLDHPLLLAEQRTRMKILLVDVSEDIPVTTIFEIFNAVIVQ